MILRNNKRLKSEDTSLESPKSKKPKIEQDKQSSFIGGGNEGNNEGKNKKITITDLNLEDYSSQEDEDYLIDDEEDEEDEDEQENNFYNYMDRMLENLKKKDKEAYNNYNLVLKEIDRREPSIIEILKTPLKLKDKAKIIELFEIYKECPYPSEDAITLREKIIDLFKRSKSNYSEYSLLSTEKIKRLKEESKKIKLEEPKLGLKEQILCLETSNENKAIMYKKFKDLDTLESGDESAKLKTWLKWATSIPHDRVKQNLLVGKSISDILNQVSTSLDKELYGMNNVKEQLLLFLNSKLQHSNMKGCSIGLVGPPGTGKTAVARTLSKCLEIPFQQISFGGVSDPEFLTGHDYTYIGSRPGEIVRCLNRMKYKNGIIFLDEFEKVAGKKGITSTLLHLTDFSQNHEFRDNYLADITIDLSNIWFIYSMNSLPEDAALRDRIFVINVEGYSNKEKVQIIKKHLLPKALKNIGREEEDVQISDENTLHLISRIDKKGDKTGVRNIERIVKDIINKIHFLISNKDKEGKLKIDFKISFSLDEIREYPLEITKSMIDKLVEQDKVSESYLNMFI